MATRLFPRRWIRAGVLDRVSRYEWSFSAGTSRQTAALTRLQRLARTWVPRPRGKQHKSVGSAQEAEQLVVQGGQELRRRNNGANEYEPAPPPSPTRGRRFSVEDEDDTVTRTELSEPDAQGHTHLEQRRLRRVSSVAELHDKNQAKFVATAWKGLCYTLNGYAWWTAVTNVARIIGVLILRRQEWIWTPEMWFKGWDKQPHEFPTDIKLYYNLIWGFYVFSTIHLPFEPRQKDFTEMMVHHIVTNLLILASYLTGMFRIGCFVMVLHDMADPWMEAAKLALYAGHQDLANVLFAIFAAVFAISRLYYYPKFVLLGTWVFGPPVLPFGQLAGFMVLLSMLQGLHIFWFALVSVDARN